MEIKAVNEIQYDAAAHEISLFINQGEKRQELGDANANWFEPLATEKYYSFQSFLLVYLECARKIFKYRIKEGLTRRFVAVKLAINHRI